MGRGAVFNVRPIDYAGPARCTLNQNVRAAFHWCRSAVCVLCCEIADWCLCQMRGSRVMVAHQLQVAGEPAAYNEL